MGHTYQSIVINAPVDKVWSRIRNFHDLSWTGSVVTEVTPVGDLKGDQIGAKRVLNGAFHETLHGLNDQDRTIRYEITQGPPPLDAMKDYFGEVRLHEITEGGPATLMTWSSRWQGNDDAICEFCHGVYVAFLSDLQKSFA